MKVKLEFLSSALKTYVNEVKAAVMECWYRVVKNYNDVKVGD